MKKILYRPAIYGLSILLLVVSTGTCAANVAHMVETQNEAPKQDQLPPNEEIRLKDVAIAPCGDNEKKRLTSNQYWLVAMLANTNNDQWAKASGALNFLNVDGSQVETVPFEDLTLSPGAMQWLTDQNLINRGRTTKITPLVSYELALEEVEWTKLDDNEDSYTLDTEVQNLWTSEDVYSWHTATVLINNTGSKTVYHVTIFGIILDAEERLLDVLYSVEPGKWAKGEKIRPGQQIAIQAHSLSKTGRCLGKSNSENIQFEYWVNAMTGMGQPITTSGEIKKSAGK